METTPLGQRIRRLLTSRDDTSRELVLTANAVTALALAVLAWLGLGLPAGWAAALVPVVFLLLTACLLFRPTVWIAAALGSAVIGTSMGVLGASLAGNLHPWGLWAGGAGGFLLGAGIAGSTYLEVARAARY